MKKFVFFVFIAILSSAAVFAVSEEIDVYAYLYNQSITNTAQLDILQQMAELRLIGAGEFYASALRRLVSTYGNISNVTERNAADEQAIILSYLLGTEKYTPAASDLWLLVDQFREPLVKAEAMMALGKIRATSFLPQVIRVLESTNVAPTPDRLHGERIAFGAIIALEKYQDPSGYLPVFFASQGWYSRRVKDQALKSLPYIARDPTPYLVQIINGAQYNHPTRYAAIQTIEASSADTKSKAGAAVAAFDRGWAVSASDPEGRAARVNMRLYAMRMINRYKTDDESVYPLLERSIREGTMDEKLPAIATLASLGTESAARRLSDHLMVLNRKFVNMNDSFGQGQSARDDETILRAVIDALGKAKQPIGRPALNQTIALNYTNAIKNLARDALREIN